MCYGLVIPIDVCKEYRHPLNFVYAWRQCNDMSSKMNVDELCEGRDREDPVVLEVSDMPIGYVDINGRETCEVCTFLKADGALVAINHFLELEVDALMAVKKKAQNAQADYEMYQAAGRDEKAKAKYAEWKDLQKLTETKEQATLKLDDEYTEATKNRIGQAKMLLVEAFQEYATKTRGHKIYFGPISKLGVGRNPPETLPSETVLDLLPRAIYRTGSGGWLHPDGTIRVPNRPGSASSASSRSSADIEDDEAPEVGQA